MINATGSWRSESAGLDGDRRHRQTQLFSLRLWAEHLDDERWEWRGEVHHVSSGELRYFRDWATLIRILVAMLSDAE